MREVPPRLALRTISSRPRRACCCFLGKQQSPPTWVALSLRATCNSVEITDERQPGVGWACGDASRFLLRWAWALWRSLAPSEKCVRGWCAGAGPPNLALMSAWLTSRRADRDRGVRVLIEAVGLTKRYGEKVAVHDLSFTVRPGVVTGFLGPNGSGKSTTMRLIVGLDAPPSGRVTVGGRRYRDHAAPLHEVGTLLEARSVHTGRSAYNHLLALAQTHGIGRRRV